MTLMSVSCKQQGPETPPDDTVVEPEDSTATEKGIFSFELLSVTATSIEASVTPEDESLRYFWTAIPRTVYEDTYRGEITAAAIATIDLWKYSFADYGYELFEALYMDQTVTGKDTHTFGGYNEKTDLYLMAFGVDMAEH